MTNLNLLEKKTWFLTLNKEFTPLSKLRNQVFTVSILIRITIINN